ncbi:MAG: D-3-phosphoglycerate dehydrogenase [Promethearchaeota archaeon CR_4]|nr:MAG: D-3-phosphoglycerate dehydrogenase [Candidatus Lokiarchaeota archaeon CR_4]
MTINYVEKKDARILLLEGIHQSAIKVLNKTGFTNIDTRKVALSEEELVKIIPEYHLLGIRSTTHLTERVFEAARNLMAVGTFCIGTNQVDIDCAMWRGIPVFNAPFSNTRSVAEVMIAEIIFLMRGIIKKNADAHRGIWSKTAESSYEIRGKTLGIVGYGNIGSQLSVLAESLGMRVQFYDILNKLPLGNAVQVPTLDQLLSTSDIVTLHVPETPLTKNMISSKQFALMKKSSLIINASRGSVVDIPALVEVLRNGQLRGAAIDVFPVEPKSSKEPFLSPLCEFDNVILTPHIAGSTLEAQENIGFEVSDKLAKYFLDGSTMGAVNFPPVNLPLEEGKHRVLHIHKNIPGVLSSINQVFSAGKMNIAGQYLQTNDSIGYVVIDLDADYDQMALEMLRQVKGTISVRSVH